LPSDCEEVEEWLKKAADESENMNWLMANTKKYPSLPFPNSSLLIIPLPRCPKCRSHIEKNGGCMVFVFL